MKLASLLTPEQVILDMKAGDHMEAITELVDHLVTIGRLDEGLRDRVLAALQAREEQVSTGIGYGVAIPHAFDDQIDEVMAVFGRSKEGVDFEALDQSPVHFAVLFVVPKKDYHLHLQTLAAIAKMFTNSGIRQQLTEASSRDEILRILAGKKQTNVA